MKANELITLIQQSEEDTSTIESLNELIDKQLSVETTEEAAEETVEETSEEEISEEETSEEETSEEETTEEAAEETSEEQEEISLSTIMTIIGDLRAENETLRTQLTEAQTQLAAKNKAEKDFIEKFKNLSVSIREEKKPVVTTKHKIGMTNGIGEL